MLELRLTSDRAANDSKRGCNLRLTAADHLDCLLDRSDGGLGRRVGYTAGQPSGIHRALGVLIGAGLLVSVRYVGDSVPLAFEHPLFDNAWATLYLRGLVVIGAAGWLVAPPKLSGMYGLAAAATALVVCLRSELWDYYLADALIIAVWGALAACSYAAVRRRALRIAGSTAAVALLCLIVGAQIAAAGALKRSLDERAAACSILEKALRAGWMKPTELSHAPFGFVAWHLFPYYLSHEGNRSGDLAGFGVYVGEHAVDLRTDDVLWRDHHRPMPRTRFPKFGRTAGSPMRAIISCAALTRCRRVCH